MQQCNRKNCGHNSRDVFDEANRELGLFFCVCNSDATCQELCGYFRDEISPPRTTMFYVGEHVKEGLTQSHFDSIVSSLVGNNHCVESVCIRSNVENTTAIRTLLAQNTTINSLSISNCKKPLDLDGLCTQNGFLTSLSLSRAGITSSSIGGLINAVGGLIRLKRLSLHGNQIGSVGMEALLCGISTCLTTVDFLNISKNEIEFDGEASVYISCPSLRELVLDQNDFFGFSGGNALAEILDRNTQLECLSLHKAQLDNDSIEAIRELLCHCTNLRRLAISDNYIEDDGAHALYEQMPLRIQELDISGNSLNYDGLKCILHEALRLPYLRRLDVRNQNVELDDIEDGFGLSVAIQYLLRSGSKIAHLHFDFCECVKFPPRNFALLGYKEYNVYEPCMSELDDCNEFLVRNYYLDDFLRRPRARKVLDIVIALDPLLLPIYAVGDIIDWTFVLEMEEIEREHCDGKNYVYEREYFECVQSHGEYRVALVNTIQRVRDFKTKKNVRVEKRQKNE